VTRSVVGAAALLGLAAALGAQVDGTARDTTRRDSLARDTLPRYLPVFPEPTPAGPLPRGTRYTFTADSFAFSSIQTLADLLARIPGVYVARGGIAGAAEIVLYGARGAAGLEIYWDGVPYLPLGRDSVFLDPARVPLAPLERVDVIVLPAALRVYLATARQRSTETTSLVGVATGEASSANYRGSFLRRWRSGLGLSLVADYSNTDGLANSSSTAFHSTELWLNAEYVPSPRFGVSYQILSSSWHRNAGPLTDDYRSERRDAILRLFAARRADGLGPRLEATLATTAVDKDTAVLRRTLRQGALTLGNDWPRAHVGVTLRALDAARPWQLEADAAWRPLAGLTLAADARRARYRRGRDGARAHVAAGLALVAGLSVRGDLAWARDLQAPVDSTDAGQRTLDVAGALRWERRRAMLEVGTATRDSFAPIGRPAGLKSLGGLDPAPRTRYLTVHGTLELLPGLHLAGWYFEPQVPNGNDFEPPRHGRVSLSFYSKFWRVYRSGIFALRGEVAMESWSRGRGGRDPSGAALGLPGASFGEANVELRVAGVTIFWIQRNATLFRGSYVPGLDYPRRYQVYGVRWVFTN
jgi:hypothetical protein